MRMHLGLLLLYNVDDDSDGDDGDGDSGGGGESHGTRGGITYTSCLATSKSPQTLTFLSAHHW
jgi:hypothetical protein